MRACVLGIAKPRVKLLNIGTEELKGTDELKDAAALLREADYLPFRFDGFTEGDQLSRGEVDVVVTDGFSGNIALEDRRRHRALRHRPAAPRLQELAPVEGRLRAVAPGAQPAQGPPRPQQSQRRGLPRPQRPGREKPRQRQSQGRRQRDPRRRAAWSATTSPGRSATTSTISAPTPSPTRPRNDPPLGRRSASAARCPSAGSPMTSSRETVDTTDAVDRRADRDPQPLCRRRRRDHRQPRHRRGAHARSTMPGVDATDIDLIVLATATPDQTFPSSATKVQAALGIDDCIAFDVHAVCTGFLYALSVADSMLRSGNAAQGAGDRRRDLQPDPRLGRPRDLRAVRRRRRRAGARRRGERTAASSPPGSTPTAATTICCSSTAGPRPPAPSASCG